MQHIKAESASYQTTFEASTSVAKSWRASAMDIQRGIIITLMAFSHCREYVGTDYYKNGEFFNSPAWQGTTILDFMQHICVTMLASGGFFMMMGIGIVFLYQARLKAGWSLEKTCLYLIKRGCLLVFLQFTLLLGFEWVAENQIYLYIGVLFALGMNMIFSSLCIYCIYKIKSKLNINNSYIEYLLPFTLMMSVIVLVQYFMDQLRINHVDPSPLVFALITAGKSNIGLDLDINFTPIPWFPAVAFGLMTGQILYTYRERSFKPLFIIAIALLAAFFLIRTANLYGLFTFGEYKMLAADTPVSFADYFAVTKYPPSVGYFLWAFGINLFCICMWQLAEKYTPFLVNILKPFKVFGQCALFFFIFHWFVYLGISRLIPSPVSEPFDLIKFWLIGLIALYFLCKKYYAFKSQKSPESIWRMF